MTGTEDLFKNVFGSLQKAAEGQNSGEWWKSFRFPETPSFYVDNLMNCARSALFGNALNGSAAVRERTFESMDSFNRDEIEAKTNKYVTNIGGRLVYTKSPLDKGDTLSSFYVFDGGAILIHLYEDAEYGTHTKLTIVGTTEAHLQLGQDLLDTCAKGKDEQVET